MRPYICENQNPGRHLIVYIAIPQPWNLISHTGFASSNARFKWIIDGPLMLWAGYGLILSAATVGEKFLTVDSDWDMVAL